eukprot:gene4760-4931_t
MAEGEPSPGPPPVAEPIERDVGRQAVSTRELGVRIAAVQSRAYRVPERDAGRALRGGGTGEEDDFLDEECEGLDGLARDPQTGDYTLRLPDVGQGLLEVLQLVGQPTPQPGATAPSAAAVHHLVYTTGPEYFKFILGSKGTALRELESSSGATIRVPKMGQQGVLSIVAQNKHCIMQAKMSIDVIVERSRSPLSPAEPSRVSNSTPVFGPAQPLTALLVPRGKLGYTHFLCLPLLGTCTDPATQLVTDIME